MEPDRPEEIHFIPDYHAGMGKEEIRLMSTSDPLKSAGRELLALLSHTEDPDDVSIVLDYAAQMRDAEGLPWNEAVRAAMIFHFG